MTKYRIIIIFGMILLNLGMYQCFILNEPYIENETFIYVESEPIPTNVVETSEDVKEVIQEEIITEEVVVVSEEPINNDDLELLAHLIFAEAGSDWCDDEMLYGVGSVVLNRMESEYFPDTMYEVIYQKGQYACTWDGNIEKEPNERAYRIAEDLLRNGPTLPENVIFQAEFKQGDGVHVQVQNMYFCYINY